MTGLLLVSGLSISQAKPQLTDIQTGTPFTHQTVIELARALSEKAFEAPGKAPESLTSLSYAEYRKINFQQRAAIWGNSPTLFSIQLFAPGYLYEHLIDVDIVEDGMAYSVGLNEASFSVPRESMAKILADIGKYAGIRLHYPLNNADYKDEFLVFQGASYFRAVSKDQQYGLSARGLAIDVAESQGEEHPIFRRFWVERPGEKQKAIVVHALLDSPGVTGAYRFGIYPDDPTRMDVNVILFPRRDLDHVGIAPLTSMFMHGDMQSADKPDYRPAVHDSEGLAIIRGNEERVWRPLSNPNTLQISAFIDEDPRGFGLIQRSRNFHHYQDLEAMYHKRPSLWVKPLGDWGKGQLQLVEIPSENEANDNIVAYWRPAETLKKGQKYRYSYRLTWPDKPGSQSNQTQVIRSASGLRLQDNQREIVIDYSHIEAEDIKNISVNATLDQGHLLASRIQHNPETGGARVFLTFDEQDASTIEFRVQLKKNQQVLTETWLYRWIKPTLFADGL
ncbi:glucan biosynthesis protein G [Methylophaga sp.]|jgi:glucan biosynthesis protein|uniref:glucan biosynthesis protein G n=1 Tax=Methylophaga sp. TaxID=2024840 RepID=UPI0013FF86EB|nr:glucan biosynthesis protein G [Methylophaga sp.]MTI64493.1 glucan biosynthesis protein G [Methylophaga sp.]